MDKYDYGAKSTNFINSNLNNFSFRKIRTD